MGDTSYKSEALESFSERYSLWHGYLSIAICVTGIPLNIINIVVLSRRKMLTPINFLLTWLAVFDIATMVSYIPFAFHFYCQYSFYSISPEKNSFAWMNFLLVYLNFSSTAHTISIWLAVALAVFRHRHVHSPSKGSLTRIRRLIRARIVICCIVFMSVLIMIPNYLSQRLKEFRLEDNKTIYAFENWHLGTSKVDPTRLAALILYSVMAKILPCVLIIVYGGLLLRTLNKSMQAKRRLSEGGVSFSIQRNNNPARTTIMLLVVIVLFLLTEFPQGILIMCSIFLQNFFEHVYIPLGDVMDILALVNNSINFVLYCSMSHEFRRTFVELFCSKSIREYRLTSYVSTPSQNKSYWNSTENSTV